MIIVLGCTISIFRLDWPIRDHSSVCCLVNEQNLFPCCHRTHYRPTLRHSWPPGPASVSPSTGHFVSHSGVTRQLPASPLWSPPTPGSQTSGDAVCRPLSPPALACLSSLSTHRQHHHQHGPVSGTSETLCHKHQDIMCVGHWDKVSP